MQPLGEAERQFLTFRRDRTPAAMARVFDLVAPELMILAGHLSRDTAAAEDLVQDTFLRAMEKAESFDAGQRLLPWMVTMLLNRARMDHRRRLRRDALPATTTERVSADPSSAAEQRELAEAFTRALDELPANYREVLNLRLVHGFEPVQIARTLARPLATVKTQLKRGKALLRQALPASLVGMLAVSITGGRGLAAVRADVLQHVVALPAATALPTATALGKGIGGGLLMTTKQKLLVVAAVLCVVSGTVIFSLPDDGVQPIDEEVGSSPQVSIAEPDTESAKPAAIPTTRRPLESTVAVEPSNPRLAALRVTVRWGDDGSLAGGVFVRPTKPEMLLEGGQPWRRTDEQGVVIFDDLPPGSFQVRAAHGGQADVELAAGEGTDLLLEIPIGVDVHGRVIDQDGVGIADARIWLARSMQERGQTVTTTGGDGRFELRSVASSHIVSAFPPAMAPTGGRRIAGEPGTEIDIVLQSTGIKGHTISGIVYGGDRMPIANAVVFAGYSLNSDTMMMLGERDPTAMPPPPTVVRTDTDGRFTAEGIPDYWHHHVPVYIRAVGCGAWHRILDLDREQDRFIEVHLDYGVRVFGRVTDTSGTPHPRIWVHAFQSRIEPAKGMGYQGPEWGPLRTETDTDGRFALVDVTAGDVKLKAYDPRDDDAGSATLNMQFQPGDEYEWNVVLGHGLEIRGVVQSESGVALADWTVIADGPKGVDSRRSVTDATGAFVLHDCEDCGYLVTVGEPGGAMYNGGIRILDVQPNREHLVIRVPDAERATATVTGELYDAMGAPLEATLHLVRTNREGIGQDGPDSSKVVWSDARFTVTPLPPGTYRLQIAEHLEHTTKAGFLSTDVFVLQPDQTLDLGRMQFEAPGFIEVRVFDAEGKRSGNSNLSLAGEGAFAAGFIGIRDGEGRSAPMQPGTYSMSFYPSVIRLGRVTVRAGETTQLDLHVPSTVRRTIRYPAIVYPESHCRVQWLDPAGNELCRSNLRLWQLEQTETIWDIAPGDYIVVVTDLLGRSVRKDIQVSAAPESDEVIVLPSPFVDSDDRR